MLVQLGRTCSQQRRSLTVLRVLACSLVSVTNRSMVLNVLKIGLALAVILVLIVFRIGLAWAVVLVMLVFKFGLATAQVLVMLVFKFGLATAQILVMLVFTIGLARVSMMRTNLTIGLALLGAQRTMGEQRPYIMRKIIALVRFLVNVGWVGEMEEDLGVAVCRLPMGHRHHLGLKRLVAPRPSCRIFLAMQLLFNLEIGLKCAVPSCGIFQVSLRDGGSSQQGKPMSTTSGGGKPHLWSVRK